MASNSSLPPQPPFQCVNVSTVVRSSYLRSWGRIINGEEAVRFDGVGVILIAIGVRILLQAQAYL